MTDDSDRYERMEADEMTADRHAEEVARHEGEIAELRAALSEALDALDRGRDLSRADVARLRKLTEN